MSEIKNCRNYSYSIQYHIVWCVREGIDLVLEDQNKVLVDILNKIINDNGVGSLDIFIESGYIHVRVDCSPQIKIPNLIKALKGVSGRLLLKEYPLIKEKLNGKSLWKSNYFISTPSERVEDQIKEYLEKQSIKEK